jgi:hypothetical protein
MAFLSWFFLRTKTSFAISPAGRGRVLKGAPNELDASCILPPAGHFAYRGKALIFNIGDSPTGIIKDFAAAML